MDGVPADLAQAIALGGEMGRRFVEYDWASHPLGPLRDWPAELRAVVVVALTTRFPIVLWLDPEQLYLVYNDAYLAVLGDRHPAALGAPGQHVWWDIWDSIGPMLRGVVTTGTATWSSDLLLPLITAAGQAEERYFTFSYSPVVAGDGHVDGIFCAVTETTERVLGERRLQVLHSAATALMETRTVDDAVRALVDVCAEPMPDLPFVAFYAHDGSGSARLCAASPTVTALLPRTLDELCGPSADLDLVDGLADRIPELVSVFEHVPWRALLLPVTGEPITGTLVIALNPRLVLDEQYRAFCRLLGDQVSAAFATAGSYDRERQRADGLAELDRAKTVFLTNVSHEFRTPLTLLLGPVQDAITATEDLVQLERLETVRRNAGRLLRLVNSLLDFSRVEAGRAEADLVRVDIGTVTAQIASSFTELCQRAGLDLNLSCASATAEVDLYMWETVVLNVLSNAVKYTLTGSIAVHVGSDGHQVRVRVTDTGTGIAAADLPHLFERFYRAGNTGGRSAEGSGIGLSLVRSLIELHHGHVDIVSELGVGTIVSITLPAVDGPVTTDATAAGAEHNPYVAEAMQWLSAAPAAAPAPRRRGELVLIADDNADMRRHLHRILSTRWDTVVFADGATALAGVRRHQPDIVVTDVMMPNLDGFGLVEALRADPAIAAIPVLMLSARAGATATGEGLARGADDYLPKPFDTVELVNRVTARLTAAARERRARNAAVAAEFSAALGTATSIDDVLSIVLGSHVGSLDATGAALGLREEHQIRITYAGAISAELRDRYHVVALEAPLPLADVIRTGEPTVITDTATDLDPRYRTTQRVDEDMPRAAVIRPVRDALGEIVGAIALLWDRPRVFTVSELDAFDTAARTSAATVNRVRASEREHRIAIGFQEQLLDLNRDSTAAVVSAVYEPAAEAMRVGGDWYLVTPLDSPTRVGVSVGDVVGHGLPAATVMSTLRAATTAATVSDADPLAVLDVLQHCAATQPAARCSTVAYAVLDSAAGMLRYACAGHPYPLVVLPDGTNHYLEDGRQPPLAASAMATRPSRPGRADLPPTALVLLYTDGLVERPGEGLDKGFARLADAAGDCATMPAGTVCDHLLRQMRPVGGYTDDVALLAVRSTGATARAFVAVVPARSGELPSLRHRLHAWLTRLDVDVDTTHNVLLTTCEAVANAIDHGRGASPRATVAVEGFAHPDTITVTVSDAGRWNGDSSASHHAAMRGRGLTLINGLADDVATVRTRRGTRVTMTYRRPPNTSTSRQGATS